MSIVYPIVFALLIAALLLSFWRLARGPSTPDRVVALDLIGLVSAGIIAAYAVWMGQPMFLDIVAVMAIVSFFGTVAFARYLERRPADDE